MRFLLPTLLLVSACGLTPTAQAATIFSVSGPNDSSLFVLSGFNFGFGAAFTTSSDHTNVTFSTTWAGGNTSGLVGYEAFLTTTLGPLTTVADEIANSTGQVDLAFTIYSPPYTLTSFDFLTVSYLPAGTYYLTIRQTSGQSVNPLYTASGDSAVLISTAPGVSVDTHYFNEAQVGGYLPATFSGTPSEFFNVWFSATGDAPTGVPEPSTAALALLGLGVSVTLKLRAR